VRSSVAGRGGGEPRGRGVDLLSAVGRDGEVVTLAGGHLAGLLVLELTDFDSLPVVEGIDERQVVAAVLGSVVELDLVRRVDPGVGGAVRPGVDDGARESDDDVGDDGDDRDGDADEGEVRASFRNDRLPRHSVPPVLAVLRHPGGAGEGGRPTVRADHLGQGGHILGQKPLIYYSLSLRSWNSRKS